MKKYTLKAQSRTVIGRKTKNLRKSGILPATIYGKKLKSTNVSVSADEFEKVYKEAGETGLVELSLDKAMHPVLIHNVSRDPVSEDTLHVEFYQVDLKVKVKTKVPVELTGESPAVAQKLGVLLTLLNEVEVEALPADLPEKITVDTSKLAAVNEELKVNNLTVPAAVTILSDPSLSVVKIGPLVTKEAEAEAKAAEEAAAAAAAQVPAEGAPTEAAAAPPAESTEKPVPTATAPPTGKPPEEKK